ncbi:MAG: hypothetical protein WC517_04575 [Patescibacteria group bacterium]
MADFQTSSSGLSDTQLKLSYFLVSNKLLLRKLSVVLLILINCGFWGYAVAGLAFWALDYGRLNQQTDELLFSSSAVLPAVEAAKPQSLILSDVQSFGGSDGHYDLMAQVSNPNTDWLAEFTYNFIGDGEPSPASYFGFALPQGRKILLALGQDSSAVRVEITDVKWTRITDFAAVRNNRERFLVENDAFAPASKIGNPSRLEFSLANESPYSYWEAGVVVFLYSGGSISAVNYLAVPQLTSGSKRMIEFNWVRPLANIDGWEIIPETNYLDSANIMPPSS